MYSLGSAENCDRLSSYQVRIYGTVWATLEISTASIRYARCECYTHCSTFSAFNFIGFWQSQPRGHSIDWNFELSTSRIKAHNFSGDVSDSTFMMKKRRNYPILVRDYFCPCSVWNGGRSGVRNLMGFNLPQWTTFKILLKPMSYIGPQNGWMWCENIK